MKAVLILLALIGGAFGATGIIHLKPGERLDHWAALYRSSPCMQIECCTREGGVISATWYTCGVVTTDDPLSEIRQNLSLPYPDCCPTIHLKSEPEFYMG